MTWVIVLALIFPLQATADDTLVNCESTVIIETLRERAVSPQFESEDLLSEEMIDEALVIARDRLVEVRERRRHLQSFEDSALLPDVKEEWLLYLQKDFQPASKPVEQGSPAHRLADMLVARSWLKLMNEIERALLKNDEPAVQSQPEESTEPQNEVEAPEISDPSREVEPLDNEGDDQPEVENKILSRILQQISASETEEATPDQLSSEDIRVLLQGEEKPKEEKPQDLNDYMQNWILRLTGKPAEDKKEPVSVNGEDDGVAPPPPAQLQQEFSDMAARLLWQATLRLSFSSSKEFNEALNRFITYILRSQGDRGKAWLERATSLHASVSSLGVRYGSIGDLGYEAINSRDQKVHQRMLSYFDLILEDLQKEAPLKPAEHELLQWIRRERSQSKPSDPSEVATAELFVRGLVGPLSKKAVEANLGRTIGEEAYPAISEKLKSGQFNSLLGLIRLTPYISLITPKGMSLKSGNEVSWQRDFPEDNDPLLGRLEDIGNFNRGFDNQLPPKLALARAILEEVDELAGRRTRRVETPLEIKKRRVDLILVDASGSMSGEREKVAKLITATILDLSRRASISEESEHVVIYMPFTSAPMEPQRYTTEPEFAALFQQLMEMRPTSSGGTSITAVLLKALQLISADEKSGGIFAKAGIHLITDAEDTIDYAALKSARGNISTATEVSMQAFVMNYSAGNLLNLHGQPDLVFLPHDKYVHHGFSPAELNDLLESKNLLRPLQTAASRTRDGYQATVADGIELNNLLLNLGYSPPRNSLQLLESSLPRAKQKLAQSLRAALLAELAQPHVRVLQKELRRLLISAYGEHTAKTYGLSLNQLFYGATSAEIRQITEYPAGK